MSTPDCVIVDTGKIRCEIKDGRPLINGKRPKDIFVEIGLIPIHGHFISRQDDPADYSNAGAEKKWCGCLLGGLLTIEAGSPIDANGVYYQASGGFKSITCEATKINYTIAAQMESGYEGCEFGREFKPRDNDDPEVHIDSQKLAYQFGVLVSDDVLEIDYDVQVDHYKNEGAKEAK